MDVQEIRALTEAVRGEVRKAVVGQDQIIDLILTSLLVGGHILIEGVPGTAKTMIVRSFAASLALQFGRIQFTPDLMPGDVLGTNLFNFQTNSFILTKGPIFAQLLLAMKVDGTFNSARQSSVSCSIWLDSRSNPHGTAAKLQYGNAGQNE